MISAWVVTSSAVVGSSHTSSFGSLGQGAGDHDALQHPARELVRVLPQVLFGPGQTHRGEQLEGAVARARADSAPGRGAATRSGGRRSCASG